MGNQGRLELKARMQRAQFKMGQDPSTLVTTYADKIDGTAKIGRSAQSSRLDNRELALTHRRTNITLGND